MFSCVLRLAPHFLNILVVIGFSWQVSLVCREYFTYPTRTTVTIVDALEKNNAPQVAFCSSWNNLWMKRRNQSVIQRFHEQLMDHPPDGSFPGGSPTPLQYAEFTGISPWRTPPEIGHQKNITKTEDAFKYAEFLLNGGTCFAFKTRRPLNWSAEVLLRSDKAMVFRKFLIKLPITSYRGHMQDSTYFRIGMTSYDSDFDSHTRESLLVLVKHNHTVNVHLSYSQKVIRLSPPPYDTNCRDYKSQGLVSKYSCFKRCLNELTLGRYNAIFEDHVISRREYLIKRQAKSNSTSNSSHPLQLIPQLLKYDEVDEKYIKSLVRENPNYPPYLVDMFKDVKSRVAACRASCSKADCVTEHIIPLRKSAESRVESGNLTILKIVVSPPKEPVTVVTSKDKVKLLDFIVYVLSCTSFWFGFFRTTAFKALPDKKNMREKIKKLPEVVNELKRKKKFDGTLNSWT